MPSLTNNAMKSLSAPVQGNSEGNVGSTGIAEAATVVLATAAAAGAAAAGVAVALSVAAAAGAASAAAGETVVVVVLAAATGSIVVVAVLAVDDRPVDVAAAGELLEDLGFEVVVPVCGRAEPVDLEVDADAALSVEPAASFDGAALATPVAPARDAQTPTVSAPAPSQVDSSPCGREARWRARERSSRAARCFAVTVRFPVPCYPGHRS
ncbi:hypothetical protein [Mycobacterium sp. DL592]|uniref:hypothetical protein n=1 Tax=Mycobacterium sp. DL592 TaxID=2675524 RepID=UPI00142165E2|nr:hypothetical protein [Mycobacterium sp. DL592]